MTSISTAAARLREPTFLIKDTTPMADLIATARSEVNAKGWITTDTATALRRSGIDPAVLERRILDSIY